MIDSKLAGTGNSRFLKSVSNFKTLYPTYDDFVAALVAGTLPIDLNGINPDGWTQQGTPLNKANLLSDDVANDLGLVDDATPNGAFNAIIRAKGKSNGFATLDDSGKVPSTQLPSMNYIPTSQKGAKNGVASLDSTAKVPSNQIPSIVEYPTYDVNMTYGTLTSSNISCVIIDKKICNVGGYYIFKGFDGTNTTLNVDNVQINGKYYVPKLQTSGATACGKPNDDSIYAAHDPIEAKIRSSAYGFSVVTLMQNLAVDYNNIIIFSATFEVMERN